MSRIGVLLSLWIRNVLTTIGTIGLIIYINSLFNKKLLINKGIQTDISSLYIDNSSQTNVVNINKDLCNLESPKKNDTQCDLGVLSMEEDEDLDIVPPQSSNYKWFFLR
jgi:hypothetical protein